MMLLIGGWLLTCKMCAAAMLHCVVVAAAMRCGRMQTILHNDGANSMRCARFLRRGGGEFADILNGAVNTVVWRI